MRPIPLESVRAVLALLRWLLRDLFWPLLLHFLPRWTLFLLALVEADVIVDTRLLRVELTAAPAWAAGLFVGLGALLAGFDARTMVSDLLLGPRNALLRRQPLSPLQWGVGSLVVLLPQGLALGSLALFWYGPLALPTALLWGLSCGLPALLLARGGLLHAAGALLACVAAGLIAAGQHAGLPLAPLSLAVLPLAGLVLERSPLPVGLPPRALPWRPRGPITALLHRDLLALWRCERPIVCSALGTAPIVGFVALAAHENGDYPPHVLVRFPLTALLLAGPTSLAAVAAASRLGGSSFDPPHWPVRETQRALALVIAASLVFMPSWALAAAAAPPIGASHGRIALFVLLASLGAAASVARAPRKPNAGAFLYWLLACLFAAIWRYGPLLGALLGAGAWLSTLRSLKRRRWSIS